mgnify:CR=1 FL=1
MEQKILKKPGFIAYITILSMTAPLGTDLNLPALPEMTEYFGTTSTVTSLTIMLFFVFMAVGTLIMGSISDRYGRKPVLFVSTLTALGFSLACAFAPNIELLLVARSIQAFGAGGMMVIATAMVRDSFEGRELVKVLSITHAMMIIAPILAPSIGALILRYSDWRMTFIALGLILTVSLFGMLLLEETLPKQKRSTRGAFRAILQLTEEVKDVRFVMLLLVGGFILSPFKGYLTNASYIYIEGFGVSESVFGIYFAVSAAVSAMGPMLNMRLQHVPVKRIFAVGYTILFVCAALLMTIGSMHPLVFLICFMPVALLNTFFRPLISGIMLSMKDTNIGAASAVMNFGFTLIGSIGMLFAALPWDSYIHGVSYNIFVFVGLSLIIWIVSLKTRLLTFPGKSGEIAPESRAADKASNQEAG